MKWGVLLVCAGVAVGAPAHAQVEGVIRIGRLLGAEGPRSIAAVQFARGPLLGATLDRAGPCALYRGAPPAALSVGSIEITGTARPITLDGSRPTTMPDPLFEDGATITVTGTGGTDVPAFSASVAAPPALTGFVPPPRVQRSGLLAVWTARSAGDIVIRVVTSNRQPKESMLIECRVPDSGSFTVPASLFAQIPPTHREAVLMIERVAATVQTVDDAQIAVEVVSGIGAGPMPLVPLVPLARIEHAERATTPRLVMNIALGLGGVSRIGDVPPTFGVSWRAQIGQRLGEGLHLIEEANTFGSDFVSPHPGTEDHGSFGAGVRWRPFTPRGTSPGFGPLPGRVSDLRSLYVTGVVGMDVRDRYISTPTGLVDHSGWSPMASVALTWPLLVGRDWSAGYEWREQLAYYDGHLQRGWMFLFAIDLQD